MPRAPQLRIVVTVEPGTFLDAESRLGAWRPIGQPVTVDHITQNDDDAADVVASLVESRIKEAQSMTDKHEERARAFWRGFYDRLDLDNEDITALAAEFTAVERETVERCVSMIKPHIAAATESRERCLDADDNAGAGEMQNRVVVLNMIVAAIRALLPTKAPKGE